MKASFQITCMLLIGLASLTACEPATQSPPSVTQELGNLPISGSSPIDTAQLLETLPASNDSAPASQTCLPTEPDAEGPFYEPGAPLRDRVGEGYTLQGVVRSADGCIPIAAAQIEFWMAGPDGSYSDEYRATLLANGNGAYRFESHAPSPYANRPPHIHIKISASGFETLVTQHYPAQGTSSATLDLVLVKNP